MTVPAFLNTGFFYENVAAGYSDAQDLMDRLELILTTELAPADRWSVITAAATTDGRWRTPTVGGRFSEFRMRRDATTQTTVFCYDQNGNLLMTRDFHPSNAAAVQFFAGPLHLFISEGGVTPDFVLFNLMDLTGIQGVVNNYTVGHANRNSGGTPTQSSVGFISTWRNGAANHSETVIDPTRSETGTVINDFESNSGSPLFLPVEVSINEVGNERQGGPLYQCVWVNGDTYGIDQDIQVPIDDGVEATFRVTNIDNSTDPRLRLAYRKV